MNSQAGNYAALRQAQVNELWNRNGGKPGIYDREAMAKAKHFTDTYHAKAAAAAGKDVAGNDPALAGLNGQQPDAPTAAGDDPALDGLNRQLPAFGNNYGPVNDDSWQQVVSDYIGDVRDNWNGLKAP